MCGICGFVYSDRNAAVDKNMLCKMNQTLQHRGPDGEGYYLGAGVGLGMKRLSIIDLKTGDQPIYNEDKTVAIVCNGEIYNYIELREMLISKGHRFSTQSDVEVIVHVYEEYKEECLQYLRGMFSFALWDTKKEQLFVARDRLGIKHLHYAIDAKKTLYFSSEYKAILATQKIKPELNPHAIQDMFTYGFILSPKTMCQHIKRLLPGYYLLYKRGDISINQYWDIDFQRTAQEEKRSADEWAEAVYEKLKESVRIHLRSDVPVAAWLSAGIDSSSIVQLTRDIKGDALRTYSMTFEDAPEVDEIARVRTLNQYPGFEIPNERLICKTHNFQMYPDMLWYQEDPTTSGMPILQTMLSQKTVQYNKVVLTGEGADELLCGYPWYRFDSLLSPFGVLPRWMRSCMIVSPITSRYKEWSSQVFLAPYAMDLERYSQLIGLYRREVVRNIFSDDLQKMILSNTYETHPAFQDRSKWKNWHRLEQLQYIENKTRLTNFITHDLDRVSMSQSLELRVPFLDHEFVELTTKIPVRHKIHRQTEKYILRRAMKTHLPEGIIMRKKCGFQAPTVNWLRDTLPSFAKYALSDACTRDKGYFDTRVVQNVLKSHRARRGDFARPLMSIIGIHMWDEIFMRNKKVNV